MIGVEHYRDKICSFIAVINKQGFFMRVYPLMIFFQKKQVLMKKMKLKKQVIMPLSLTMMMLVGCNQPNQLQNFKVNQEQENKTQNVKPANLMNTLTVYTSQDIKSLQPLIDDFNKKTGILVKVVQDSPMSLLARIKAEGEKCPADVLLTQDVGVFWQAKEQGMLQPFSSDKAITHVPEYLRDPNGEWLPLAYYTRTIVYDSREVAAGDISSYADLAKPKWQNKLCLTTGKRIENQSLVVSLMQSLGDAKTTQVLQGWVANTALPVFPDDKSLMKAIESGQCQIGIVNSDTYSHFLDKNPQTPVKLALANQGYGGVQINVSAAAITKTAKHPEFSLAFIEWLANKEQQGIYASLDKTFPANNQAEASVALKSWGDFEANLTPVSKYGEMQKNAVDLMKEAGYY